jgi:phosphoribulokinase
MKVAMEEARLKGNNHFSHFGPEANLLEELAGLFKTYGKTGKGKVRKYLHNAEEAAPYGQQSGEFTPWEDIPAGTDLMFYEGLHGAAVTDTVNVAQHADLLVGVVPTVNLEWIQKLHRDKNQRGYSTEAVVDTILRRMPDYINYITPQFSRTHVNFQRVPTVDTSNPFIARDIPDRRRKFCGDPLCQFQGHRLPLPAVDDPQFLHVTAEHHRGARRQDGTGDATDLHAADPAHDGEPQAGVTTSDDAAFKYLARQLARSARFRR